MFGLAFLFIIVAYVAALRRLFSHIRQERRNGASLSDLRLSAIPFALLVLLPAWYFFGFLLSSTYSEFRDLCQSEIEVEVVRTIATDQVFHTNCEKIQGMLWAGTYRSGVCMTRPFGGGDPLLLTKKAAPPSTCQLAPTDQCFDTEPTILPPHAYDRVLKKEERKSLLFANSMISSDYQYIDQQGGLLAHSRSYRHYPLGSRGFAIVFGFASGQPPSTGCRATSPGNIAKLVYSPTAS